LCPGDAVAQNNLGDVFERAGDLAQAREHYARAVAADGKLGAAQFGLGDVALAAGVYDEAVRAYERGLVLAPADAVSRCRLRLARTMKDGGAVDGTLAGACLGDGGGARGVDPVLVPAGRLPLRVPFAAGKADLEPGADAGLGEVAAALSTMDTARFRIEAYATADESADPAGLARRRGGGGRDPPLNPPAAGPPPPGGGGRGAGWPTGPGAWESPPPVRRRRRVRRCASRPRSWSRVPRRGSSRSPPGGRCRAALATPSASPPAPAHTSTSCRRTPPATWRGSSRTRTSARAATRCAKASTTSCPAAIVSSSSTIPSGPNAST